MKLGNIREKTFLLASSNNFQFQAKSYYPEEKDPKAIVQIVHGMAEHMGRYHDFATFLAQNGVAVYLHDHPGHGEDAHQEGRLGIIPKRRGWEVMLENTRALYTHIRKKRPDIPLFLFGHSMGSVLVRHFTAVYPIYLKGLVLSAPFETPAWLLQISRTIVNVQAWFAGQRHRSKWFNRMFYGNLNRPFRKGPTRFEWISSQREEIDAYVNDPMCGFDCSIAFYNNLFKGIAAMRKAQQNLKYRKTLPVLILAGQQDPVGHFGKDAIRIHQDFYQQKFQNLTIKVFPGRHELLHDSASEQLQHFFLNWIEECLTKKKIIV
jgi:alpha-beta hydrolase superfamily lysophospholipase